MSWCLMSSDVIWHIRDKLWPMPKHGSIKSAYVRCMRVLAVTCHLHFLAEWPGSFTYYCGNTDGMDTEVRVSTESWPWIRKFSRCLCWDSNLRPFDHESVAPLLSYPWFPGIRIVLDMTRHISSLFLTLLDDDLYWASLVHVSFSCRWCYR